MKKTIVITSIFEPTEAVQLFAQSGKHDLIVVGDKKSPENWTCEHAQFIAVKDQLALPFRLINELPFNHYSRKMIGYLLAIKNGAECIIDTDDDNLPLENWDFPLFNGQFESIEADQGFVNIYQLFTDQKIWPRGLPLHLINKTYSFDAMNRIDCNVGIWQGLADEDPDVDAIYRLTSDLPCYFNKRNPVVLSRGTVCPFNTQNTLIRKELYPLLYLPTYVTFRFTDILRGLVAQPIMWLYNYALGFTEATVIQKRNPHDYMKDFISEIPMYEKGEQVIELVSNVINKENTIAKNMQLAYQSLAEHGIVNEKELITLDAWLADLDDLQVN